MRKFSSYGPIEPELHYYVPRQELIDGAIQHLLGDNPDNGGQYISVWAPHQTGKTSLMLDVFSTLKQNTQFDVAILSLQNLINLSDVNQVAQFIAGELIDILDLKHLTINTLEDFHRLFEQGSLNKPLILILDEFDALEPAAIAGLVAVFRHIYLSRQNQQNKSFAEKDYLLHGMALIGIHAALGVENVDVSLFNIQRSVHIPNLTHDEVIDLFNQYQQESGQVCEPEVVERIWYEFQGQPGLTCWFGELLTEKYNQTTDQPITMANFEGVYVAALDLLPNINVLNIINKATQADYKPFVLELFQTGMKIKLIYDDPIFNVLYLNGVVSTEQVSLGENDVKFSCPYVQKQLFGYFARELFQGMDDLYDPFEDLSDTITDESLNIRRLLQRYEQYLQANREMVLKNAPRRQKDLRVFEAVFQFHLYEYFNSFLSSYEAQVQPEFNVASSVTSFPTGNGAIDLLIRHAGQLFGIELKSFANQREYRNALTQAAKYGKQLKVTEIALALFIETVDETNRQKFETDYTDPETGVIVHPQFVQTG
ncbi:MAG: hypothetical protein DRR16_16335 [Candidatus Parabeggiatoa sp. nov. 3]|nr:MAG: hypothetical protein DRR00_08695 [Gammaproteobacteria bacterium]RKZ67800.1 MAG: hypothetical protein DRQ99_05675 [Gammaproteobacteria bacterium]RKZ83815.1 MAG: hypothetical protein DRR16_16335 [Gammaproteobacteria bacterium]